MTDVMQEYNTTINKYRIPGCQHLELLSDEYWACKAQHYSMTIYHPVGTAKMGPDTDPMAVVDPRLKVKGKISQYENCIHLMKNLYRGEKSESGGLFYYALHSQR